MTTRPKPLVISVAAVSGGGKTTVTKRLAEILNRSKALYFDDYEFSGEPDDLCEWVAQGADCNVWNLSPLRSELQFLSLCHKPPLDFIVMDYPFAYLHEEMKSLIDFAIFIDTPLDMAMARRIVRDYTADTMNRVASDMLHYLDRGRPAYMHMLRTVKPSSDIVVDGELPLTTIIDTIVEEIGSRYKK